MHLSLKLLVEVIIRFTFSCGSVYCAGLNCLFTRLFLSSVSTPIYEQEFSFTYLSFLVFKYIFCSSSHFIQKMN